jgi:hypothetical protein
VIEELGHLVACRCEDRFRLRPNPAPCFPAFTEETFEELGLLLRGDRVVARD